MMGMQQSFDFNNNNTPSAPVTRRRKRGAERRASEITARARATSKAVADTSVATYHDLLNDGTIDRRKRLVLESLASYEAINSNAPTIRELHAHLYQCGRVDADPNSVKPRVCELKTEGLLRFAAKRICSITGKLVYTIQTTERGRLLLNHLHREAKQQGGVG